METFSVDLEDIASPDSFTPSSRWHPITWNGRAITDLTKGVYHCYLYPAYSPSGVSMTSENPV